MKKLHFAVKLLSPLPGFPGDMTTEERAIMQQHVAYNKTFLDEGIILVYGPVMDSAGIYGLGIFEVDNEEQVKAILSGDPASAIAQYEYYPMMAVTPVK